MNTRIKELSARHNLTQSGLASMVGVRWGTIHFLEIGKYNPSLKLAYRVARALGSTIEEGFILGGKDLQITYIFNPSSGPTSA
jgi:putative transcriptional regulator